MSGELNRKKYLEGVDSTSKYVLYVSELCEKFLTSCSVDDLADMISDSIHLKLLELIIKAYRCEILSPNDYDAITKYVPVLTYSEYKKSLLK